MKTYTYKQTLKAVFWLALLYEVYLYWTMQPVIPAWLFVPFVMFWGTCIYIGDKVYCYLLSDGTSVSTTAAAPKSSIGFVRSEDAEPKSEDDDV